MNAPTKCLYCGKTYTPQGDGGFSHCYAGLKVPLQDKVDALEKQIMTLKQVAFDGPRTFEKMLKEMRKI